VALPTPNLDDRTFQQLVDEAKRMVQTRCPEWTDHNVSDPGVTLIETFAYMVDQLVYRVNQIPDRNFIKFLELIGVRLFPATAARAPVTFWLSAPQATTVAVPSGTVVATTRTEHESAVSFTTSEHLDIVACAMERVGTQFADGAVVDTTDTLLHGQSFPCFSRVPQPGDSILIGLTNPVPSCAISIRLDASIEGVGVVPDDPPLAWEAWCGSGWRRCEVDSDETGGLNRAGAVVLHVPKGHEASVIGEERAGWVRAVVLDPADDPDRPQYSASPRIGSVSVTTVGGTADATNAQPVANELLGLSEGVPGQRFELNHRPVAASIDPVVVEVAAGSGWEEWREVQSFSDSGPDDRHFILDEVSGEVVFGPSVRLADGTLQFFGAVPPKGAPVRIPAYLSGGGHQGNVSRGAISVLRTTIPFIARVVNRVAASGGVDAETVESAKVRGPISLRTRNRAVTAEDYEQLAREAAPEVARVRCTPASTEEDNGGVRVLVVPAAAAGEGPLRFEQLVPEGETLTRIAGVLYERRCVGARVIVEPPRYQGITVVARIRARRRTQAALLLDHATTALYHYFSPLVGGPAGDGWPFGRPIHVGEVYAVLQGLDGCEFVEDARLFGADPLTGRRGEQTQRLDLDQGSLVFSYDHQVVVEES